MRLFHIYFLNTPMLKRYFLQLIVFKTQMFKTANAQSWALLVFLNFFNNKEWIFAIFIKLIWLGVGFLNRTGAETGYELHKKCK